MKKIFTGLEGSGKSLALAMQIEELIERNSKWLEKTGIQRPIRSRMQFTPKLEEYAHLRGVPITYWRSKADLIKFKECDVIIDEIGNLWNSRQWTEMSIEELDWLSQGAKNGVEMYGAAQDFAMVDKGFRRLVNELYHIRKIVGSRRPSATKPPVKFIWGLCQKIELDPQRYNEQEDKFEKVNIFSFSFFFIRKEFCEYFNTNAIIERSKALPFRHVDRNCEEPNCEFHKIAHI